MKSELTILMGPAHSGVTTLSNCFDIIGIKHLKTKDGGNFPVAEINQLIYQDFNLSPSMTGQLPVEWMKNLQAEKAISRIKTAMDNTTIKGHTHLADPHFCRFICLWNEIFQELEISLKVVLIIRHPWEVAQSMQFNDGIEIFKAHINWLSNIQSVLPYCKNGAIVTLDELIADPVTTIRYIYPHLPVLSTHNCRSLIQFVNPKLKTFNISDLFDDVKNQFKIYEKIYHSLRNIRWENYCDNGQISQCKIESCKPNHPSIDSNSSLRRNEQSALADSLLQYIGLQDKEQIVSKTNSERSSVVVNDFGYLNINIPTASNSGYKSERILLNVNEWQNITVDINDPSVLSEKSIVLKPHSTAGMVRIAYISIVNKINNLESWTANTDQHFEKFSITGTAIRIASKNELKLLVTGEEPCVVFPKDLIFADGPAELRIQIKISHDYKNIKSILSKNTIYDKEIIIRTIHHLSCSGGTVISKCIAAMHNVVLLSEVHPTTPLSLTKVTFEPWDPVKQFRTCYPELIFSNKGKLEEIFCERLHWVISRCTELEKALILRDHAHSDFLINERNEKPTLLQSLSYKHRLIPIVTLRNPIDSYLSLLSNPDFPTDVESFDIYCQRVLKFLQVYNESNVFLYEDFVDKPDDTLKQICQIFQIDFDPTYKDRFHKIVLTGDSGRGKKFSEIEKIQRRHYNDDFREEIINSNNFHLITKKYPQYLNSL